MGEDDAYFQLVLAVLDNSGIAIKLLDILKEAKFHPLEQQEIFKNISNHNNNDECMVSCTVAKHSMFIISSPDMLAAYQISEL